MTDETLNQPNFPEENKWLRSYYFTRAAVSAVWVAAAFTMGKSTPAVEGVLLFAYLGRRSQSRGCSA